MNEITHPPHYLAHPSGIECITVVEYVPSTQKPGLKKAKRRR